MKKQLISLEEKRLIQIGMLKEFDSFCRKNNLRYSLAYGTLIGAIRHKGFIPWDDDMDISMPLPDIIKAKQLLHSDNIYICDVDNNPYYAFPFPRIVHKKTYRDDGLFLKGYGINIDVYPLLSIPSNVDDVNTYFKEGAKIRDKRLKIMRIKGIGMKFLPLKTIPLYHKMQLKYRDFLFQYPFNNDGWFLCFGGGLAWHNVLKENPFKEIIDVSFEGNSFMAIASYDSFLRQVYGDYMQLPPENQRFFYHGGDYYWR